MSTVLLATALLSGVAVGVAAPQAQACTTSTTTPGQSRCYTKSWHCVKTKKTWYGRKCIERRYY